MMKSVLLAGVAAAALTLAAPAASAGGYKPYISVFGGAALLGKNPHGTGSVSSYTFDILMNSPGYIIGGAVGVDWGNQIRTEVELSHARWTGDKYHYSSYDGATTFHGTNTEIASQTATYLLGNVWVDLANGSQLTPYVGGGLGIGWAQIHEDEGGGLTYDYGASGLAFQLGAGIRFNVSDRLSIDAGYRFKDIVGLSYSTTDPQYHITDTSLSSHNFQIGLTYQF
jgi:opacity protein-like surface antigen